MSTNKKNANAYKPVWLTLKSVGRVEIRANREIHKYIRSHIPKLKCKDVPFRLAHAERDTGVRLQFESKLHATDPTQDVIVIELKFCRLGAL